MKLEKIIKNACEESISESRTGDTEDEIKFIQNYLKSAQKIIVPSRNTVKLNIINRVLKEFGLQEAEQLHINTSAADLNRLPALSKAIMALDQCECDLIISRGRLGVPGSGSMLVIIDKKGRILTAATSPSHVVHKKEVKDAVSGEIVHALERIGLKRIK